MAQTIWSKLRRSDLFVENRSAQDSQLRRSGIFRLASRKGRKGRKGIDFQNLCARRGLGVRFLSADVAPTELDNFLIAWATKIPLLRSFGGARLWSQTQPQRVAITERVGNLGRAAAGASAFAVLRRDESHTTALRIMGDLSLTPWLQPGVKRNRASQNRFNGFSSCAEAVETAGDFLSRLFHRAKATVLMRGAQ